MLPGMPYWTGSVTSDGSIETSASSAAPPNTAFGLRLPRLIAFFSQPRPANGEVMRVAIEVPCRSAHPCAVSADLAMRPPRAQGRCLLRDGDLHRVVVLRRPHA